LQRDNVEAGAQIGIAKEYPPMRTDDFRPSTNVENDRAEGGSGGGGIPGGGGSLGIGTVIVLGVLGWYFFGDPTAILNMLNGGSAPTDQSSPAQPTAVDHSQDDKVQFVTLVLGDTEDRWKEIFAETGRTYHPAELVLFQNVKRGGCGTAQSAMGPFYCPLDKRIYLDLSFFEDLQKKFDGCSSDTACRFSEAYVVAHEVGHHVQDEFGTLDQMTEKQQAAGNRTAANALQVRIELQADCFAGVWANRAQAKHHFLDPGDVDQALQTASAIGDDRLEKETQGYVVPDSFTHGTSEQRKRWFSNGFNSGQVAACNTLTASSL
jgi:uncharacterized protein